MKTANGTGTVQFRGNPARWWARVTARDEHGNKVRPWVDLERPDLKNTPEDKAIAKRLAAKKSKKASRMVYVGKDRATAPRVTVEDLEDKWLALLDGDPHLKASTRSTYKSCWRSQIKPRLGKLAVVDVSIPVLRSWVRELAGELSASTVRNNAIALTRFLGDVRAEGWAPLPSNPMRHEDVRALLPTVHAPDPEEIVFWTRPQAEQLLALPTLPHERFGLYLVALLSGLRAGELRGLTFAHVVFDGPVPHLRVRQQVCLAREAGESAELGTPKTRSSKRDVPLHAAALEWLTWWRDSGWSATYGRTRTDEDALFPAVDGEAGRPRDANILRRDLTAADLLLDFVTPDGTRIPYTFHATRRTFSRLLGDSGVLEEVVGMLDGHAAQSVTKSHYMGRSLEVMARAVATLTLALPERPGVSSRPETLSPALSKAPEAAEPESAKVAELAALSQLHPIELPQFKHL
jgi:integrase